MTKIGRCMQEVKPGSSSCMRKISPGTSLEKPEKSGAEVTYASHSYNFSPRRVSATPHSTTYGCNVSIVNTPCTMRGFMMASNSKKYDIYRILTL